MVLREKLTNNGLISDQDGMIMLNLKVPLNSFTSYGNMAQEQDKFFTASRLSLACTVNMEEEIPFEDINPTLLDSLADVMDAPALINHSPSFARYTWRRFISDTTPCFRKALDPDELDQDSGMPLVQTWFFQIFKAKSDGKSLWKLRNPDRLPKLSPDSLGWNTFHFRTKYVPIMLNMASTCFNPRQAPTLLPTVDSMNDLLKRWVLFQKKKSTQKFMAFYRRSGFVDGQFDQDFFQSWLQSEIEKMDDFYLLDFFKRMVRESISPDGVCVTRIFPRLNQVNSFY